MSTAQPSSAGLGGRDLVQVAFATEDLPRAVAFYRDVLGLPLMFEAGGMAFFQLGNARLMIGSQERDGPALGPGVIYLDAPDLAPLSAELEARGVAFRAPADTIQRTAQGELKLRFLSDPDGNMVGLMGLVPAD